MTVSEWFDYIGHHTLFFRILKRNGNKLLNLTTIKNLLTGFAYSTCTCMYLIKRPSNSIHKNVSIFLTVFLLIVSALRAFQTSDFPLPFSMTKPSLFLYNFIFGKKPGIIWSFLTSYNHFDCFVRWGVGFYFSRISWFYGGAWEALNRGCMGRIKWGNTCMLLNTVRHVLFCLLAIFTCSQILSLNFVVYFIIV